ncbi:MAG: nucleotide exchange factor GrpE [Halanaerobiales bacterium]
MKDNKTEKSQEEKTAEEAAEKGYNEAGSTGIKEENQERKNENDKDSIEDNNQDTGCKESINEEDGGGKEEDDTDNVDKDGLIEDLQEKVDLLQAEKEGYIDRLQRLQAEFSNYRRRTDKEMGKIQSKTIVEVIRELLPIIDNFERALAQETNDENVKKGVEMIYRQLVNFLKKQGVEKIAAQGEEFDHNYHEAVMQVESEEHESGIIIEELQKGYILGDKIIRPAMVKVAQ